MTAASGGKFFERIRERPLAPVSLAVTGPLDSILPSQLFSQEPIRDLILGTLAGSPYLKGLITRDPGRLERVLDGVPEEHFKALKGEVAQLLLKAESFADAMAALRVFKTEVALLTALAD